jgi:hypothetical protein
VSPQRKLRGLESAAFFGPPSITSRGCAAIRKIVIMPVVAGPFDEPDRFDDEHIDRLTPRERRLVQLRFGLIDGKQRSLQEIASRFHLTEEHAGLVLAVALKKLSR